jgi:plastocyanin
MTLPRRLTRSLASVAAVAALAAFAAGSAVAANGEVDIDGLEFVPGQVTINVGDSVTWTVTNAVPEGHTVTSGQPDDPDQGSLFDSGIGLQESGETYEFTFEDAGTFAYYCQIHGAAMSGEVVVLEAGASEAPASEAPASEAPASEAPNAESPAATEVPFPGSSEPPGTGSLEPTQIPAERRLLAAGVLLVAIVIMFAGAAVWRRMNPG